MPRFGCPRCDKINTGKPHFYQTSGFARCDRCKVGLEWSSKILSRDIEVTDTYIPDGSTVSPKTGKVLDSNRVYMSGPLLYYIKYILGLKSGEKRMKREGNLLRE